MSLPWGQSDEQNIILEGSKYKIVPNILVIMSVSYDMLHTGPFEQFNLG